MIELSNPPKAETVMFTGIIEAIGTVRECTRKPGGAWAHIGAGPLAEGLRVGDSIAVDGACLTVTALRRDGFTCDLSAETLERTTLGTLRAGSRVNLERPLRLGDRLGGHLVSGHVDAVGEVAGRIHQGPASRRSAEPWSRAQAEGAHAKPSGVTDGEFWRFRFPQELAPLLVMKGSIAVDGISLTIAELSRDTFGVALIPHTLRHTTLGGKRAGDPVNLEADLLGKHVARLLALRAGFHPGAGSTPEGGPSLRVGFRPGGLSSPEGGLSEPEAGPEAGRSDIMGQRGLTLAFLEEHGFA
jgi:riboflavin synthase